MLDSKTKHWALQAISQCCDGFAVEFAKFDIAWQGGAMTVAQASYLSRTLAVNQKAMVQLLQKAVDSLGSDEE